VAGFVGVSNLISRGGEQVAVRPERVRLVGADDATPPGTIGEVGTVTDVMFLGALTRYVVELDSGGTLMVTRSNTERRGGDTDELRGRKVKAVWSPDQSHHVQHSAASVGEQEE